MHLVAPLDVDGIHRTCPKSALGLARQKIGLPPVSRGFAGSAVPCFSAVGHRKQLAVPETVSAAPLAVFFVVVASAAAGTVSAHLSRR